MPAVIFLCRCHSFSNGIYLILERKLLKPHSKCFTVSPANYTEEFWRRFLNTLVCQSFPPPPPPRSLRIISFAPSASHFQNEYQAFFLSCPGRPSKTSFPLLSPPVAIFKGRSSLWPVAAMLVRLCWKRAKKLVSPLLYPVLLTTTVSLAHHISPFIVKDCLSPRLTSLLQLPTVTCTVSYN